MSSARTQPGDPMGKRSLARVASSRAVLSTVLGQTRPGSIVSMHFGHPGTVTALPAIVRGLASRGLRPVTLTELFSVTP